jgi:sugar lactone lactonase YvrE
VIALFVLLLGCPGGGETGETGDTGGPLACDGVSGHICTFAGYQGLAALGREDVPANESYLYLPQDLSFSPDGEAYLLDWNNHRIRRVDLDGTIHTIAGTGLMGDGPEGQAKNAAFNHPAGLSFRADGQLLIAAWHNSRVELIDLDGGTLSFVAGNGTRGFAGDEGDARTAVLDLPSSVVEAADGTLYVSDSANMRIRTITTDGLIHTYAGDGTAAYAGDGGAASAAQFNNPKGQLAAPAGRLALSPDQQLYIADTLNQRVRVIDLGTGVIETVVGTGTAGYSGDGGAATAATLFSPADVALGPDGELYIADTENSCIRVVREGVIDTFAGVCGEPDYTGDNGPAASARVQKPYGVAVDGEGNVFIADTYNHAIRVVWR